MKRRELEIILQGLDGFDRPDPTLEQYTTPAIIASDVLYFAAGCGDVTSKKVVDLGCGNGIFAIGACLLGAGSVKAVDLDPAAVALARDNAKKHDCVVEYEISNVEEIEGRFDTCIQNPPFGAQNRHADIPFLLKATEIADVVYSMHNSVTDKFIRKKVEVLGGRVDTFREYDFEIKHTFDHHRKEKETVKVTLYRIVSKTL
jgi:putative methylase